jgi:hypothetical protein
LQRIARGLLGWLRPSESNRGKRKERSIDDGNILYHCKTPHLLAFPV